MAAALIKHEQIMTTLPKAKDLRGVVEALITLASGAICMPGALLPPAFGTRQWWRSCSKRSGRDIKAAPADIPAF